MIRPNFNLIVLFLVATAAVGCGGAAAPPLRVRYAELDDYPALADGRSVIVEFDPGDRIPVELTFKDDAFDLMPVGPKLELVARRRCFIQIGPDRLRTSLTGSDFDRAPRAPGRFHVGLELTRQRRRLVVDVMTPKHRDGT
jgi:hypothetical protein